MLSKDETRLLDLIHEDVALRDLFFSKVADAKFFYPLKSNGYFEPTSVPDPIEVDGGYQFPYWPPVGYLQKLSKKIKDGESEDLIGEILQVIKEVTLHLGGRTLANNRQYFFFVDILGNIPNHRISKSYLEQVMAVWLKIGDAFYTSPEIIERLIPKFLPDNPTKDDIEKIDLILRAVLHVDMYIGKAEGEKSQGRRFNRELYWLNQIVIKREYYKSIAVHLPNDFVFYLADQLKAAIFMLFPGKYSFNYRDETYEITLIPKKDDVLKVVLVAQAETILKIDDFEKLDDDQLVEAILLKLSEKGMEKGFLEEVTNTLKNAVRYRISGDSSVFRSKTFFDEEDVDSHSDVEESYVLYLKHITNEISRTDSVRGEEIIGKLLTLTYRNAIFKRLAIFLIASNWASYKAIFWELIDSPFAPVMFNEHYLASEMYQLLSRNAGSVSVGEAGKLEMAFEKFTKNDKTEEQKSFSMFRWYAALKELTGFREKYAALSEKYNLTSDYFEEKDEIKVRVGDESPLTTDQLLKMEISEILASISNFKPDSWMGPSARGFSSALEQAINSTPERFSDDLDSFVNIPYVYAHGIISGFQTAWKNRKNVDWPKLLDFCEKYISTEKFISGALTVDDGNWGYRAEWIDGIIGNLLTNGTQSDDRSFSIDLVGKAENILTKIIKRNLAKDRERKEPNDTDYPMFAINTTMGKVYRALLDCSLRNRRQGIASTWDKIERPLFDQGLASKVLEIDVYVGWHFRQFYFLDQPWVNKYLAELSFESMESWKAFMGGHFFPNPLNNIEIYQKLRPHYEFAIEINFNPKNIGGYNGGLTRHLGCFYFWEFDRSSEMMKQFIDKSDVDQLSDLIHFLRVQQEYTADLKAEEKQQFLDRILDLWAYLLQSIQSRNDTSFNVAAASSADIIMYFDSISPRVYDLVKASMVFRDKRREDYFIQKHLASVMNGNNTVQNAEMIAKIFLEMLDINTPTYEQENIRSIVKGLFKHKETKDLAIDICDRYLRKNYHFLRDIRKENT